MRHFLAEYQGHSAKFTFGGEVIVGNIASRTALRLIKERALLHNAVLEANWNHMKAGESLERIAPLE